MESARSGDDRLPWLDAPRPAKKTRAAPPARTRLLILLGLFLAGAIAVMAFLVGRGTVPPVAPQDPEVAAMPAPVPAPPPTPAAETPIAPPVPVVADPIPLAETPVGATPGRPRARTEARRAPVPRATPAPAPTVVSDQLAAPAPTPAVPAAVPVRPTAWVARPFAGRSGRVIQLGAHLTQEKADAAWWRLARAYPYLTTLPRMVTWYGPSPGRPRYYRVRIAAGSNREARALCRNLVSIGRACTVV